MRIYEDLCELWDLWMLPLLGGSAGWRPHQAHIISVMTKIHLSTQTQEIAVIYSIIQLKISVINLFCTSWSRQDQLCKTIAQSRHNFHKQKSSSLPAPWRYQSLPSIERLYSKTVKIHSNPNVIPKAFKLKELFKKCIRCEKWNIYDKV